MVAAAVDEKKCPDCAEMVKAEARVCRFCGHRFDVAPEEGVTPPVATGEAQPSRAQGRRWGRIAAYVGASLAWVLLTLPAGRYQSTGPLAALIVSFGLAAVIRGVWVAVRKERFWSPGLFVIAAIVGVIIVVGLANSESG